MSNEDKMRGEFHKYMRETFGSEVLDVMVRASAPTECSYAYVETQASWEIWKACAAINDAEIKQWQRIIDEENKDHIEQQTAKDAEIAKITAYAKTMETQRHAFRDALDAAENEIASRDLMIKELREAADELNGQVEFLYQGSDDPVMPDDLRKAITEIEKALAKSEHHDSRALEKMLLEAELKGLENISGREWTGRRKEIKVKLAELNRNDCVCKDTLGNPLNECNECPR